MDVLRYYFPVLCQLVGIGGIVAGGPWVWAGVTQLVLFAALDPLLGDDLRERKAPKWDSIMDIPLILCAILGPITLVVLAWRVGQGGLSTVELLGLIASGAWLALVPVVPAVHELYHKRSAWKYALGTYTQFPYGDCTRSVAHMMSHHNYVRTPRDADNRSAARACTPSSGGRSPRTTASSISLKRSRSPSAVSPYGRGKDDSRKR